ncbi:MAG: MutS-related protein [Mongoliitalea sp.]
MISSFDSAYLRSLKKKSNQKIAFLAILRLLFFILLITFLILAFAEHPLYILAVLATSFGFAYLIKLFNSEQDLQGLIRALLQMQEERVLRAARDLSSLDAGEEFTDKEHPFASDLDLFGKHSLFQLLNHTVTKGARQLLASRLRMQQPDSDSLSIQQAIPELSQKSNFLQLFEGLGKAHHQDARDFQLFEKWLGKEEHWKAFYWLPMVLGPLGGVAVLLAAVFGWMPPALVGIWILLGVAMMGVSHSYLKEVAALLPSFSQTKMYRLWAEQIHQEPFTDSYLVNLSQEYRAKKNPISKGLYSLEQLTFLIQNRFNLMYIVLNAFFWLDFILVRRIFNWKQVFASGLGGLRENLDRWQLLVSYAIFVNEEGLTCFPTWINESSLQVTQLKHPLIGKDVAVGNDFSIDSSTRTILLTGANMSGKTTFMRTIGINLVLANQGLPVFASSFQAYPFQLFTSMRNSDNLGESVSSFYAELARIKKILSESERAKPVFFLMDEILKGTNTTDRIMGSEALIEQLAATSAKGIISTHDIELSALEEKHSYLKNFSFHSDIQDNSIHFDYTIKMGPCPAFNAKKLMQLMGIRL